jgi:sec-independent protein translocase protein TatA
MEETDNMPRIGGWEWVIVLVIVLLIFGVGRLSKVGRELGEGIREFRKGLTGREDGNGENQEEI